ncbi:alpha/beta hydrolase, partial [Candidatus Pacearchaeota archaeon]|nr:alpha/beta hydrolase [Candidatus Pacearchaeota archaeon]
MKKGNVFFLAIIFLIIAYTSSILAMSSDMLLYKNNSSPKEVLLNQSFLEKILDHLTITGYATSGPSRFLWKPTSESDGHLVILVSGCSGASLYTLDGDLIEKGSSRGASNGYSDTIRFKKRGSAYPDRIVVHTCGGRCYIKDTSARLEKCSRPPAVEDDSPVIPPSDTPALPGQTPATSAYEEKVFYGNDARQFYMLKILPEHQNSKRINLGFYIHGGGFTALDTTFTQFYNSASRFESQGYSSIHIEYRVCNSNLKWPVPVSDSALAINHAAAKLKSMGYEINNTFIIGHSAGAMIGAFLLYSNDYANITEVDKLISLAGVYNPASIKSGSINTLISTCNFEQNRDLTYHGKTKVPALIVQGYGLSNSRGIVGDQYDNYGASYDASNPNSHMNFLANKLVSYGVPVETYAVIPGHHGTPIFNLESGETNYLNKINTFLKKDFCNVEGACPYKPSISSLSPSSSKSGIIIPLYLEDQSAYSRIVQARNSYPNVPIVVIINPDSGPGATQDSQYVDWISQLQTSGVTVVGYVYTGYGTRNINVVKADIDKYKQFYPSLNGIFYDEMNNQAGSESYYQSLISYSNIKGFGFSVGNPGIHTISSYINMMNITLIYEDDGLPALSQYLDYVSYDNSKLGMIPLNVPVYSEQWVVDSLNIVGWLYLTNDKLDNPWDTLSAHFEKTVETLNKSNVVTNSPSPSSQNYMIVDLNSGAVSYLDSVPSSGWSDEYKTTKLVLRKIPAGSFKMGSPATEPGRCDAGSCGNCAKDFNQHQVTLTKDYYIAIFETTQKQYELIMGSNPSLNGQKADKNAANIVSWSDARGGNWPNGNANSYSFTGKLSTKIGVKFDLPTEAQWEYACKAGTNTGINTGTQCSSDGCVCSSSSFLGVSYRVDPSGVLSEIGKKTPNTWGIYDMHGGVGEWVLDWFSNTEVPSGNVDPVGYSSPDSQRLRTIKGDPNMGARLRCASRSGDPFASMSTYQERGTPGPGFRVVTLASSSSSPSLKLCTTSDWDSSPSSLICPKEGYITITWVKLTNCIGGVEHSATEQKSCIYNPTPEEKDDDLD